YGASHRCLSSDLTATEAKRACSHSLSIAITGPKNGLQSRSKYLDSPTTQSTSSVSIDKCEPGFMMRRPCRSTPTTMAACFSLISDSRMLFPTSGELDPMNKRRSSYPSIEAEGEVARWVAEPGGF